MDELSWYYNTNSLRVNHDKTQGTAFHLKNKEAMIAFKVEWYRVELDDITYPKYLGVTLDRTLNHKEHIQNTKMKLSTRNDLLKKLANSKWGTNASIIRPIVLALCNSVTDYAASAWTRSARVHMVDPEMNNSCRTNTGCQGQHI